VKHTNTCVRGIFSIWFLTISLLFSASRLSAQEDWDFETWDDSCYDLTETIQDPAGETAESTFETLQELYNQRIDHYKVDVVTNKEMSDVSYLKLAVDMASKSDFLAEYKAIFTDYLAILDGEEGLFEFLDDDTYDDQIAVLWTALYYANDAETQEADAYVHNFCFEKITLVFNNREGKSSTDIRDLRTVLQNALKTPLLNAVQEAEVAKYLALLDLEIRIRAALVLTDFDKQLNELIAVQDENIDGTFEAITQDVYAPAPNTVFNNRIDKDADQIEKLISYLEAAQTHPLLSPEKQAEVATMLEQLAPEKALIEALKLTEFSELLPALDSIVDAHGATTVTLTAQTFFFTALQALLAGRSTTDGQALASLIALLNKAIESSLLSEEQKALVRDEWLTMTELERIMAIEDYEQRLAALKAFLDGLAEKTLSEELQTAIAEALRTMYNQRPSDDSDVLGSLLELLDGLKDSNFLPDDLKAEIAGTMLPTVTSQKALLRHQE